MGRAFVRISIHAPREGSDSLTSARDYNSKISIHAPREGSDRDHTSRPRRTPYFYPRSPRGERLALLMFFMA